MQRMMFALSFGFAALLYLTVQAGAASPAPPSPGTQPRNCAPREVILTKLREEFGELRQSMGLVRNSAIIEVFASEVTGTWTITATLPSGVSCIVMSGEYFETLDEQPAPRGAPA